MEINDNSSEEEVYDGEVTYGVYVGGDGQRTYRLIDAGTHEATAEMVFCEDGCACVASPFGGFTVSMPDYALGYCYLTLVVPEKRVAVAAYLGPYPTFDHLMMGSDLMFLREEQIRGCSVVQVDSRTCHVSSSAYGASAIEVLVAVAVTSAINFKAGSYGSYLMDHYRSGFTTPTIESRSWKSTWRCGAESVGPVEGKFLPGIPVLGDVDVGQQGIVADRDDIERGLVAGFVVSKQGNRSYLYPRISRKDYADLQLSRLPEEHGYLENLLAGFSPLDSSTRQKFLGTKKAVRQDMPDGTYRVLLVGRVPEALDEVDLAAMGCRQDLPEHISPEALGSRPKTKTYALSQVFYDSSVLDKYPITLRQSQTAKRLAASDPAAASVLLQDAMNAVQEKVAVRVVAGDMMKDKGQARNTLKMVCRAYPPRSASVLSAVIGDELFMYGPEGEEDWHVRGPLKFATEVSFMYWMVYAEGPVNPVRLLDLETVLLSISVCHEDSYMLPVEQYHMGSIDSVTSTSGLASATAAHLSLDQRLGFMALKDRLLPIRGSLGEQVATSVRVTGKYALINAHVVDADPECLIGGKPVATHTRVSRDLWSARLDGDAQPWLMRDPRAGELAAVCYSVNGRVACSSPVTVVSVDSTCVITTIATDVTMGCSGGALVSLDDMALLGIHSASTQSNLVSYRFGSAQFSALLESDCASSISRHDDVGTFAASVVEHFRRRGLIHVFNRAAGSLLRVTVSGEHVGMAVRSAARIFTVCDVDLPLRYGPGNVPLLMTVSDHGRVHWASARTLPGDEPMYRRVPVVGERVFMVGFDTSPYISSETEITHVGPEAKYFAMGEIPGVDRPLLGGLVMAWDGAVLGVCGNTSAGTPAGRGYMAWPLPEVQSGEVTVSRAELSELFPFMTFSAWADSLVEEVFTHSSVGVYASGQRFNAGQKPLANIGDSAAKAELHAAMRSFGLPHAAWATEMQRLQSNSALARVAWDKGLSRFVKLGIGVAAPRDAKLYADTVEAFLGAAYIVERREVFQELCRYLGVLSFQE